MAFQIYDRAQKIIGGQSFFSNPVGGGRDEESGGSGNGLSENLLSSLVCYMGGIIKVKDVAKFKKLLIRTTRAQTLVHDFDLVLPDTEKIVDSDYDMNRKLLVIVFRDGQNIKDKL